MALINCPDCGREVSNRAPACIFCGCPLTGDSDENELVVVEQKPLAQAPVEPTWIIGSEWTLPEDGKEQRVHCLDCDRDVYFPAGQEKHSTHRVEPLEWSPHGWLPVAGTEPSASHAEGSSATDDGDDWGDEDLLPRWDRGRIFNFTSRTRPSEFWAYVTAAFVTAWVLVVVGAYIGPRALVVFWLAAMALWLVVFLGASVNRLHDIGQSGWLVLLYLVPIANFGLLLYAGISDAEPGPNEWGPPIA